MYLKSNIVKLYPSDEDLYSKTQAGWARPRSAKR
jgi:hypothetical protein